MDLTRKVAVRSRARGVVNYKIDSLRVKRIWQKSGDIINIPIDELIELTTIRGGQRLLDKYLVIEDKEALKLIYDYELAPEYSYGEAEIDFLLHAGTNEQLFDALDYAPQGALDLIRIMAIKNKPDTILKLEAINNKFGINLNTIIKNSEADTDSQEVEETPIRRSAPVELSTDSKSTSKYKVIDKK